MRVNRHAGHRRNVVKIKRHPPDRIHNQGKPHHGALRPSEGPPALQSSRLSALHLQVRLPHAFRAIPHLDPALQARLSSALQRPEIHPETRAKIQAVLNQSKNDET